MASTPASDESANLPSKTSRTSNSLSESHSNPSLLADFLFIHASGATHSWVRGLTLLPFDWSNCPTFLANMHKHRHRHGVHPNYQELQEMLQKLRTLHSIYIDEARKRGSQDQSDQQSVSGPSRIPKKRKSFWTKPSEDRF